MKIIAGIVSGTSIVFVLLYLLLTVYDNWNTITENIKQFLRGGK